MKNKRWTNDEKRTAEDMLCTGSTHKEVGKKIRRTPNSVRVWAQKKGILISIRRPPSKISKDCAECGNSFTDYKRNNRKFCSRSCSVRSNNLKRGTHKRNTKVKCPQCENTFIGRSSRKFCSIECASLSKTMKRMKSGNPGPRALRSYLAKTRPHECEVCKTKVWEGNPIPLEVDHVDGNYENNIEENLRRICPNCHALTPTYKGKNKGNGRFFRRTRYAEGKAY